MARKIAVVTVPPIQRVLTLPDMGLAIRAARTQSELRIDTAASLCDVSVSLLSALENGSGRAVGLDKVLAVLDNLGLTMLITDKSHAEQIQQAYNHDPRT